MDNLQPIGEILAKNRQGLSQDWNEVIAKKCVCGSDFNDTVWHLKDDKIIQNAKCRECRAKDDLEKRKQEAIVNLKKVSETQREVWIKNSGIPEYFILKTFENYEPKLQQKAFNAVKNLRWKHNPASELRAESLVLASPGVYGVGKTHLMAALMHQITNTEEVAYIQNGTMISTRCCPFYFITENELLRKIRDTYNPSDDPCHVTEEDIYKRLRKVKLLIIDDVGKVRPKDYSFLQGVYFNIIDRRYTDSMPMVITTNLDYTELENHIGGACADRLREMCGDNFIKMSGASHRR